MPRIPLTARFEYVDKEGVQRVGKGRTLLVDGIPIDLFPSGVLCAMLWRSQKCLYGWELDFGFPQALWRINDDKQKQRWYSRRQLIAIRAIYEKFNRLQKKDREKLPAFIKAVRAVFYVIDQPTKDR